MKPTSPDDLLAAVFDVLPQQHVPALGRPPRDDLLQPRKDSIALGNREFTIVIRMAARKELEAALMKRRLTSRPSSTRKKAA